MGYGGIDFGHVWAFQIKCMMANQYEILVEALKKGERKLVIAACLRLGWNDAFRHTSKNNEEKLTDKERADRIFDACKALVDYFEEYAKLTNTRDRVTKIDKFLKNTIFFSIFGPVKDICDKEKPLCLGHIQKMFNIAIKLILCLILSAERANAMDCVVILDKPDDGEEITLDKGELLTHNNFPYDFDTADCPIDSIILKKIDDKKDGKPVPNPNGHKEYSQVVWSKLGAKEPEDNYTNAQEAIKVILDDPAKSNLYFDFINWNK